MNNTVITHDLHLTTGEFPMSTETFSFKSEAKQLLDLMIHSLYSTKDIFLRELISNASDALDKLRFESLTDSTLSLEGDLKVQISTAGDANSEESEGPRRLLISDNGIGMSRDEMISNLGTIARSGTRDFISKLEEQKKEGESQLDRLIGQFGVGFYSSFIAAQKVEVLSRRAGTDEAWLWTSEGDGEFTLEPADKEASGTTITLYLREADSENGLEDFTAEWTLRQTIKRYSDFVQYPIELLAKKSKPVVAEEGEDDEEVKDREPEPYWEWEQVNSMKAIWKRNESEVSDDEYNEFYRHISKAWDEPQQRHRFKTESPFEMTALLFVPASAPHNLHYRDTKHGLQLYANRVLIKETCEEVLPTWLRFMKGVVESPDISLNVSRELLQQDRHVKLIRKQVTKKSVRFLRELLGEDRDGYQQIWDNFGEVLKESVVDFEQGKDVQSLFLFKSSAQEEMTTLDEYIERMGEDQEEIYFITGESVEAIERSPHLEAFKSKEVEVLYMDQPIDEWMMGSLYEYEGKQLRSISQGDVELGSEEERQAAEEERKAAQEEAGDLLEWFKGNLSEHIKEVRLSHRLTDSPACLVNEEGGMTPQMERMMRQMGQEIPKQKRILELNPKHELFSRLKGIFEEDQESAKLGQYAQLIYGQALIAEGSPLTDPSAFNAALIGVMAH
jgi:molecular chaperone HtpG